MREALVLILIFAAAAAQTTEGADWQCDLGCVLALSFVGTFGVALIGTCCVFIWSVGPNPARGK